jgi:hypothetical protein
LKDVAEIIMGRDFAEIIIGKSLGKQPEGNARLMAAKIE